MTDFLVLLDGLVERVRHSDGRLVSTHVQAELDAIHAAAHEYVESEKRRLYQELIVAVVGGWAQNPAHTSLTASTIATQAVLIAQQVVQALDLLPNDGGVRG